MKKNNKLHNKRLISAHNRGFTLVEVVVAMGIFVIVTVGSSGVFASAFKSYRSARNINENLKNAQYAMNLMSKTFRTSTVKYPATDLDNSVENTIVVYDYSQAPSYPACIRYRISGGNLFKATSAVADGACNSGSPFGAEAVMVQNVSESSFLVTNSRGDDGDGSSEKVGKITVRLVIGSGADNTRVVIQSTSSLRDYKISNIGLDLNNPVN